MNKSEKVIVGADGKTWKKHAEPDVIGWWPATQRKDADPISARLAHVGERLASPNLSLDELHAIDEELRALRIAHEAEKRSAAFTEGRSIADEAQSIITSERQAGRQIGLVEAVQRAVDRRRGE